VRKQLKSVVKERDTFKGIALKEKERADDAEMKLAAAQERADTAEARAATVKCIQPREVTTSAETKSAERDSLADDKETGAALETSE